MQYLIALNRRQCTCCPHLIFSQHDITHCLYSLKYCPLGSRDDKPISKTLFLISLPMGEINCYDPCYRDKNCCCLGTTGLRTILRMNICVRAVILLDASSVGSMLKVWSSDASDVLRDISGVFSIEDQVLFGPFAFVSSVSSFLPWCCLSLPKRLLAVAQHYD